MSNSLVSDRLNELYKKYFQDTDYKMGQSFDAVKNNMSSEDYDKSQKLLDYYSQQNTLKENLDYSNKLVEKDRLKSLENNSIAKEKTMMYLPEYLKLQGMGGLGVSQSSIIQAQNNYNNARNNINSNANDRKLELQNKYDTEIRTINKEASESLGDISTKYQEAFKTDSANLKTNLETSILEKVATFNTDENGRISTGDKNKLKEMININRDNLTEQDQKYLDMLINNYEERPQEDVEQEQEYNAVKTAGIDFSQNPWFFQDSSFNEGDNFFVKDSTGKEYAIESGGRIDGKSLPLEAQKMDVGSVFAYQNVIYYKKNTDDYIIIRKRQASKEQDFKDLYSKFY